MSENNGSTGNKKFLKGTLILTASSMVVKVIGSVNWIILSRILGGEGIGLYQMGFPIYLMAITVSSAGIPVAISIITAEKVAENDSEAAFYQRPGVLVGAVVRRRLAYRKPLDSRCPRLLFHYRAGAGSIFCNLPGQLPRLFAGLADYDADGGFRSCGAADARCYHDCVCLYVYALRTGICGRRRKHGRRRRCILRAAGADVVLRTAQAQPEG